jgi:hypothetical protein
VKVRSDIGDISILAQWGEQQLAISS